MSKKFLQILTLATSVATLSMIESTYAVSACDQCAMEEQACQLACADYNKVEIPTRLCGFFCAIDAKRADFCSLFCPAPEESSKKAK